MMMTERERDLALRLGTAFRMMGEDPNTILRVLLALSVAIAKGVGLEPAEYLEKVAEFVAAVGMAPGSDCETCSYRAECAAENAGGECN